MPLDRPDNAQDISALWQSRKKTRDPQIGAMNQVAAAIKGHLPEQYSALFTSKEVRLQLRTLRSADDALTKFLSEIPISPHVPARGKRDTDTARNKAETVEKAAYGWMGGAALRGGPEFTATALQLARYQVRFGDGVLATWPDRQRKLVWMEAKDPRNHFPPEGWGPFSPNPLDETLLVTEMTLGEVIATFCKDPETDEYQNQVLSRLVNTFGRNHGAGDMDLSQIVSVGQFYARAAWYVSVLADTDVVLRESQDSDRNHPGVCPLVSFAQFDSEPMLLGQIGIEAAIEKTINQQIENTERINKAGMVGPPLLGDKYRWGEYNVVDLSLLNGRSMTPQRLAPDSPNNLMNVTQQLLMYAQMFNYNPESNQGQGPANSGKAIQQLQAGPRSLVTNILFSPYKVAFPRSFDNCLEIETNLWPNERKTVTARKGKKTFEVDYTPSATFSGFKGHMKIEDARTGGYNAFLEAVQKKDAGMASLRDVLEADPNTGDVEATIRRIHGDQAGDFLKAAFEGAGSSDPLMGIKLSAELIKRLGEGKSRDEAIQDMLAEGLLEPPAPEAPPGMEDGALPPGGLPPELAGLFGGAPPAGLTAVPSLNEALG